MTIVPENTRVRIEPGQIGSPILMGYVAGYTVARPAHATTWQTREVAAIVTLDPGHRFDAFDSGLHVAALVVAPDNLTETAFGEQYGPPEILRPPVGSWWKAKDHVVAQGPDLAAQDGDIVQVHTNNGPADDPTVTWCWEDGSGSVTWPLRQFVDTFDGPFASRARTS